MTARTIVLEFDYRETPWRDRVEAVCRSWAGTKYKLNKCSKGIAVDCIHFGAAVLDELYGSKHAKDLKSLPPDACVHNRAGVQKATRALLKAYPSHARVLDNSLEAGDLVITGPRSDEGPTASHLLIAGRRAVLWQAALTGVNFTGYSLLDTEAVVAVYRASDKQKWLS